MQPGHSVSHHPKKFFFDTMPPQIFMIFGMQAYTHKKKLHFNQTLVSNFLAFLKILILYPNPFLDIFFQRHLFFKHIASHN